MSHCKCGRDLVEANAVSAILDRVVSVSRISKVNDDEQDYKTRLHILQGAVMGIAEELLGKCVVCQVIDMRKAGDL